MSSRAVPVRHRVDVHVDKWHELQDQLFKDSEWKDLRRLRTKYLFRGLADKKYPLTTTLQRMEVGDLIEKIEPKMIRQFKKYAHRDVVAKDTIWHWLSIAQHHGLPSRLLDWTNSPFVALHFTVKDKDDFARDGAVWAINFEEICKLLPESVRSPLEGKGVKVFTVEELVETFKGRTEADALKSLQEKEERGKDFMVLFEPPSIDDRIVNQYALLSMMSRVRTVPEEWLRERGASVCRKVTFPARLKPEIRDRLDMMNVTERVLLPGLDGLTAWLKRYYGPSLWKPEGWAAHMRSVDGD